MWFTKSGSLAHFVVRLHRSSFAWLVWSSLISVLISSALKGPYTPAAFADSLDLLSWRVYTALSSHSGPAATLPRGTVVLGISQHYFETRFGQSSPLDRMELARLVAAVSDVVHDARKIDPLRPIVVAIDLDLSPPTRSGAGEEAGQRALEATLGRLAESATVVVLCPFKVETESGKTIKQQWMSRVSELSEQARRQSKIPERGLWFASPDLLEQLGTVLQYEPSQPTLGALAGRALRGERFQPETAFACMTPASAIGPAVPALAKINSSALRKISIVEIDHSSEATALLDSRLIELVVIGGTYRLGVDEFQAADGKIYPGAALHAAVAYTEQRPISQRHKLVEPAIGVLLACLLQLIAKPLILAIPVLLQPPSVLTLRSPRSSPWTFLLFAPRTADTPELWLRWVIATLLMSLFLILLLLATGYLSAALLQFANYWVDFGTLSLVIFLKILSAISLKVQSHGIAPVYLPADLPAGSVDKESGSASDRSREPAQAVPFVRVMLARTGISVRASVLAYGMYSLVYKIVS